MSINRELFKINAGVSTQLNIIYLLKVKRSVYYQESAPRYMVK